MFIIVVRDLDRSKAASLGQLTAALKVRVLSYWCFIIVGCLAGFRM